MPDSVFSNRSYRRSVRTSFFLVLFLVLIGGVVRSTGAGMGCPDWPKCFGLWIPPTSISEIPLKFWDNPLSSAHGKIIFNPIKTWTEYLNRLLGVLIGIAILVQAVLSLFAARNGKSRFFSFLSLVLVIFQGWLGSRVVSTDLKPVVISLHLLVALFIGLSLLAALFFSEVKPKLDSPYVSSRFLKSLVFITSFCLLIQFFLGTEVRSQVDVLFREFDFGSRDVYADRLDWKLPVHRSFSVLIFLFLFFQLRFAGKQLSLKELWCAGLPLVIVFLLVLSGISLVYLGFPAFVQPFHLLFGFSVICAQFWLCLHLFFRLKSPVDLPV
jgi:cytochrome c oxidase assembly protein subunit 15